MKAGVRGAATLGVVVGTIIAGPAGAVVAGAAGGLLRSLRSRFHDIGIDDKFMKQVAKEIEKGKSALFVQYTGTWAASIGFDRAGDHRPRTPCCSRARCRPTTPPRCRRWSSPPSRRWVAKRWSPTTRSRSRRHPRRRRGDARPRRPRPSQCRAAAPPARGQAGDDLTQLVGIGPKAAGALTAAGIATYAALSEANEPQIRRALHDADMTPPANVSTWPMQASSPPRATGRA